MSFFRMMAIGVRVEWYINTEMFDMMGIEEWYLGVNYGARKWINTLKWHGYFQRIEDGWLLKKIVKL